MKETTKLSTAALRRLKRKRHQGTIPPSPLLLQMSHQPPYDVDRLEAHGQTGAASTTSDVPEQRLPPGVTVEYLPPPVEAEVPEEFASLFRHFALPTAKADDGQEAEGGAAVHGGGSGNDDGEHSMEEEDEAGTKSLSKKRLKLQNRMSLSELKQYARRPEVVEWEDVTAKDPKLLVHLKALAHTVPVPRHWFHKRKYLSGKRGYVKPPFELPAFIRDTGITELRDTMRAQDAEKTIKVKAREKMHPKLGRITVDYERLYDAFFKYQTKPPLTRHGELYYEGKEFEGSRQEKKPGHLSEPLRIALGLASHIMPPPWLHNMQKYGPPPSYPHMKIPGLNSPIPDGAQWGYHPGGWGRPPVDNLFLRNTVEGSRARDGDPVHLMLLNPIERNLWGELEPEEELPAEDIEEPDESSAQPGDVIALQEEEADEYYQPPLPPSSSGRTRDSSGDADDDPKSAAASAVLDTPEALEPARRRRR